MARIRGSFFTIDADKHEALKDMMPDNYRITIDYNWANADDHQEWLDNSSVDDIVNWLLDLEDSDEE